MGTIMMLYIRKESLFPKLSVPFFCFSKISMDNRTNSYLKASNLSFKRNYSRHNVCCVEFKSGTEKNDVSAPKDRREASELIGEFCIIETRDSVRAFENLQVEELEMNIQTRRNKLFLLMEEIRRLKIQHRMKQREINKPNGNRISMNDDNFNSASHICLQFKIQRSRITLLFFSAAV